MSANSYWDDVAVRSAIDDLLSAKKSGAELERGPRISAISDFIEREMANLEHKTSDRDNPTPSIDTLNELFRSTLKEAWQEEHSG